MRIVDARLERKKLRCNITYERSQRGNARFLIVVYNCNALYTQGARAFLLSTMFLAVADYAAAIIRPAGFHFAKEKNSDLQRGRKKIQKKRKRRRRTEWKKNLQELHTSLSEMLRGDSALFARMSLLL